MTRICKLVSGWSLLLLTLASVSGCAPAQNTPMRTPARESIPSKAEAYSLRIITIVSREPNEAVDKIKVTATSGNNRITDFTGVNGAVALTLPFSPGDSIAFEFIKDGIYWVAEHQNIPIGATTIKVYFQLSNSGRVSFSRIEY